MDLQETSAVAAGGGTDNDHEAKDGGDTLDESGGSFLAIPGGLVINGRPVKFVQPPMESQLCLFCKTVLRDPVLSIRCGHTFCRTCCEAHMVENTGRCPVEETEFSKETLVVNVALANQISGLLVHCRYGLRNDESRGEWTVDEKGCPQTVRFGEREEHESVCDFAKLPCPNDRQTCGVFLRKALAVHVLKCPRTPCPNADQGEKLVLNLYSQPRTLICEDISLSSFPKYNMSCNSTESRMRKKAFEAAFCWISRKVEECIIAQSFPKPAQLTTSSPIYSVAHTTVGKTMVVPLTP